METFEEYGLGDALKIVLGAVAFALATCFVLGAFNCAEYLVDRAIHAYGWHLGAIAIAVALRFVYRAPIFFMPVIAIGFVLMMYGFLYLMSGKEFLTPAWEMRAFEPALDVLFPDEFAGAWNPANPNDNSRWECRRY